MRVTWLSPYTQPCLCVPPMEGPPNVGLSSIGYSIRHWLLSHFRTPFNLSIQGQLRPFPMLHALPWQCGYYGRSVNRHFQSDHFKPSHRHSFTAICRVGLVDPVVRHERSSLNLGRPFVPLNTLIVYRPSFRESPGQELWPSEDDGQGYIPLSQVFMEAPLRTSLQVIQLLPYST